MVADASFFFAGTPALTRTLYCAARTVFFRGGNISRWTVSVLIPCSLRPGSLHRDAVEFVSVTHPCWCRDRYGAWLGR